LSEHLAHRYNWLEAQATDFVLTGSAPVVYPITVRVKRWRGITPPHIILDIDAATAPKDVLQAYTEIRRQLIGGKRHRPRSEKVAHLVAFVLKHQGPWLERMGLWNRTYPQWAYESERVMARDYHRAAQGLLQP